MATWGINVDFQIDVVNDIKNTRKYSPFRANFSAIKRKFVSTEIGLQSSLNQRFGH